jgi:hypothetical protein
VVGGRLEVVPDIVRPGIAENCGGKSGALADDDPTNSML